MVNLSADTIVFNISGAELTDAIIEALDLAAEHSLKPHGLEDVDLSTVTTKKHLRAAFAKFVNEQLMVTAGERFDEAYVKCAFDAYRQKPGYITKSSFETLMGATESGPFRYKASYARAIRVGLGLFLLALHSSGAITLPAMFHWPLMRKEGQDGTRKVEVGRHLASELLSFVRTLDSHAENLSHPAFKAIGGDRKRREWFLSYATRLLLATGWHHPEDANVDDLLKIKASEKQICGRNEMPLAYSALLDVLNLAFPGRIKVTSAAWSEALRRKLITSVSLNGKTTPITNALQHLFQNGTRSDYDLLDEVLSLTAAWGRPERVRTVERLPGLDIDIKALSKLWLDIEDLYIRKNSRENYKGIYHSIGWWNAYLFYYLPYWFHKNPQTSIKFPSSPSLLYKSVFVSHLLSTNEERPIAFIEFMAAQAEKRRWTNNSLYSTLLNLQKLFEFVERYSNEIPGCEGFVQPFSPHDYPKTSRPFATNKQPVPREFFGLYLDYHEALIAHHNVVLHKVLAGELDSKDMQTLECNGNIIDTFATSDLVGFIPILFTKTKTLALQIIPNVLDARPRTVQGGRTLILPHPHSLHQNLVALHTGLRHNHIQWLDKNKFDSLVNDSDTDFALLFVNTDKQKTAPWTPHVSIRVIDLLRAQRGWCDLIDEPEFHSAHFYNNNPSTKWPKIQPLFAYTSKGKPHQDNKYTAIWQDVLCGLQGLMPELRELGKSRQLLRLLPPGHKSEDHELAEKLAEYGRQFQMGDICPLKVVTSISPHSARVAVVSQYFTILPADLIGKYITGQKRGVVIYYVHIDKKTIEVEQVHQAARMRDAALRSVFEPILSGGGSSTTFVHADNVNSKLARSMKANLEETIASHGGMSISFSEVARRGIDVLRETGYAEVAFNKTEICPYGNNCPPDIVKEFKGMRRCALCPYAVRFIDHLPAVLAKKRQIAEIVDELEKLLTLDSKTLNAKYNPEELESLETERFRLCEDLSGWTLNEEVLEIMRQRIATGQDTRIWTVQRPDIIENDLQRVSIHTSATEYILARLGECIAFPILESPQVRARFDLLRRELLARAGNLRAAFASSVPVDTAAECAGLLKSIISTTGLTIPQLAELLDNNQHMADLPRTSLRLLSVEEDT